MNGSGSWHVRRPFAIFLYADLMWAFCREELSSPREVRGYISAPFLRRSSLRDLDLINGPTSTPSSNFKGTGLAMAKTRSTLEMRNDEGYEADSLVSYACSSDWFHTHAFSLGRYSSFENTSHGKRTTSLADPLRQRLGPHHPRSSPSSPPATHV